jgi:asparagine synthase (glutamine-hydrolysing)
MRDAVEFRLHGDVPVCFHLSGGLDSSSILGLATHLTQQPQHAFTLEFEEAGYDESEQARDTAGFCKTVWHPVRVTRKDILDTMAAAVIGSEGLAINGHLPAKYLLNRAIHESGFRAVLSGEGADELFAGYAHLRLDHWRSLNSHDYSHDLSRTNASQVGMMLPSGDGLSLSAADQRLGYQPVFLQAKATLGKRLRSLMNPDWLSHREGQDPCDDLLKQCCVTDQLCGRSALRQSTWLWSKLALAGYIFRTLGDGTEMPWSVEGRVPFADHILFESIRDLRADWLIRNGVEKYVLREAMRPYVTDAVYSRQKHPLDAPPVLTGDLKVVRSVRERIECAEFRRQPFFCQQRVMELLDRIPGLTSDERKLWDPALMMILSTIAIQQLIDSAAKRNS